MDDALRTFASAVETAGLLSLQPLPGFRFFANGLVACTVLSASPVLGFKFVAAPGAFFSNACWKDSDQFRVDIIGVRVRDVINHCGRVDDGCMQ